MANWTMLQIVFVWWKKSTFYILSTFIQPTVIDNIFLNVEYFVKFRYFYHHK